MPITFFFVDMWWPLNASRNIVKHVPVMIHGSFGWAWIQNLVKKLLAWEGKILARSWNARMRSDEVDDLLKFWRRRVTEAREAFKEAGMVSIHVGFLKKICRNSFRLKRVSPTVISF